MATESSHTDHNNTDHDNTDHNNTDSNYKTILINHNSTDQNDIKVIFRLTIRILSVAISGDLPRASKDSPGYGDLGIRHIPAGSVHSSASQLSRLSVSQDPAGRNSIGRKTCMAELHIGGQLVSLLKTETEKTLMKLLH